MRDVRGIDDSVFAENQVRGHAASSADRGTGKAAADGVTNLLGSFSLVCPGGFRLASLRSSAPM